MSAERTFAEQMPAAFVLHEQAALACPLIDPGTIEEMAGLLPEHFSFPLHETIWRAILEQHTAGVPLSMGTVGARVAQLLGKGSDLLETACLYLPKLPVMQQVALGAGYHAEQVRAYATLRRVQEQALALLALCDADDLRGLTAAQELGVLAAGGVAAAQTRTQAEVVGATLTALEERMNGATGPTLPTGIDALAELNTFGAGHFIILAARTNVGKSLLAFQMAQHMVGRGYRGLFVSLEMSGEELMQRGLSAEGEISPRLLALPELLGDEWVGLTAAAARMAPRPLVYLDCPDINLETLVAAARRLKATEGLDFMVLDYLQLLPMPDPSRVNTVTALEAITKRLKRTARELDITILALSQINREGDGVRPELRNLRGGGSQEQDADAALLLWPNADKGEEGWAGGVQHLVMDVRKNRHGAKRAINLVLQPETLTMVEV